VFIQGASGTGKSSWRGDPPREPAFAGPSSPSTAPRFPRTFSSSELFGHRKGSFTGASYDHKGLISRGRPGNAVPRRDRRHGLSPSRQSCLRVLQDRKCARSGDAEHPVDVRIVSATHRESRHTDERGAVPRGTSTYRLNVVSLQLPPLSERREDIVPLAAHYLRPRPRATARTSSSSSEAMQLLARPRPGRET